MNEDRNAETLAVIKAHVEATGFTGKVVLHCLDGEFQTYEATQRFHAPHRERQLDAAEREGIASRR